MWSVPSLYIPWPRFDRRALLLLLDDHKRLLLCGTCCCGWTVPQVRLDSGSDFEGAATSHLRRHFGISEPRYAPLRGLHESPASETWQHDRYIESHVLIVRVSNEQSAIARDAGVRHALWNVEELRQHRREISPEGVVALVAGFVEGWLPDGSIRLH